MTYLLRCAFIAVVLACVVVITAGLVGLRIIGVNVGESWAPDASRAPFHV